MTIFLKISVVGAFGCGKSALVARLTGQEFPMAYRATLGAVVHEWQPEPPSPPVAIWDIEGWHDAKELESSYLTGSQIILIVADGSKAAFDSGISGRLAAARARCAQTCGDAKFLYVLAKHDGREASELALEGIDGEPVLRTSARLDIGLGALREALLSSGQISPVVG